METFASWFSLRADHWISAAPARSDAALARLLDLDRAQVCRYRAGTQTPSPRSGLPRIAALLAIGREDAALAYRLAGVDVGPVSGRRRGAR